MKILYITCYYPPYNTIGAVRSAGITNELARLGHDVHVIAVKNQPYDRSLPMPVNVPQNHIHEVSCYTLSTLIERFHKRDSVGVGAGGALGFISSWTAFAKKVYRSVFEFPDRYLAWVPLAYRTAKKLCRTWKPDIIYASFSPLSSLILGSQLANSLSIPWVAEFRDVLWYMNVDSQFALRQKLDYHLEKVFVKSASGMTSVSAPLAEALTGRYHVPCEVVMNGYDEVSQDVQDPCPDVFSSERVNLLYTGRGSGTYRTIEPLAEAICQLGGNKAPVDVWMYGTAFEEYQATARRKHLEERIHFRGKVPYAHCRFLQRTADVLLLTQWNDPGVDGVLTGKFFEYISTGRPILAVGWSENLLGRMVNTRGLGLSSDDPDAIAKWLTIRIGEKKRNGSVSPMDATAKDGFSRREQVKVLDDFLRTLIKKVSS